MPSVSFDSSLGYSPMLPANWMPKSHPTIPSFRDDEVKNGIQAPHVAPSPKKEHFRHNLNTVNALRPCVIAKKTGGVAVYGYRHYTPKTGQFLGRDPIGEKGGMNLYGWAWNDGTNSIDLLGLCRGSNSNQTSAARAASNAWNAVSIRQNKEHGGLICRCCKNGEMKYYFTHVGGTTDTVDPLAAPCDGDDVQVAYWHTHGGPNDLNGDGIDDQHYDSERFSNIDTDGDGIPDNGDIPYANHHDLDAYVATPLGQFFQYNKNSGKIIRRRPL